MDPKTMLATVIVLLAMSALGGLTMAGIRFAGGRNPPAWLAMGHGFLAGAGLTLLVFSVCVLAMPMLACWAALLLGIAALGGVVLNLGFDQKQKLLPKGVVVAHALLAVSGVLLLLLAYGQS